ncbi:MAG: trigger factor [Proteobacteria bacterium]|nr:trigger factor [Pseudomonadota bacterium]
MQVTELEGAGLKKQFKVTVEAPEIDVEMEAELKAAGERVRIPGFRPGNIPMKVLRQRYGKSVQGDVLKNVINKATSDLVNQRKLRPALTPQISIEDYQDGGALIFNVSFEVFPESPEVDLSGITISRSVFEISEKDIDEAGERIAERMPKMVPAEKGAKAQEGNVVVIDFKGMIDGVAFPGGTAQDFRLELGSGQFIEGFEDQLIGAKAGDDREVKVTFPKDYPSADLAGKASVFEVKVKGVEIKENAVINEEFATERGFESLAKLRDAIRDQLQKEYDQVVRNQMKKELFDILETKYDFDLPQGMVDLEFGSIWERLKQAQQAGDESVSGRTDEDLKEEYTQIARRRVKLGLLLADIGNRNKLEISREELMRAVMQQASMYPGQEKKVMDFYRNNPERLEELRGPILEEKAVDYILSKIKFNDKKVTLDDLGGDEEDGEDGEPRQKKASKSAKPAKKAAGDDGAEPKKTAAKKKAAGTKE